MTRPLHVAVDGDNLSHRVFHASGRNRNEAAFLGLVRRCVERVVELTGREVTHLLVAFDSSTNVRRETVQGYKADRPERDADLDAQMTACRQALVAAGVSVECVAGWEADDVLASHVASVDDDVEVVVISSDRDLLTLVGPAVSVLRLTGAVADAQLLGPEQVEAAYGVRPEQYTDFAALRGDASDNLPGVAGIGAKTAAGLLAALGSVQAALDDPDAAHEAVGSRARHLVDGEATWRRNVAAMTLRDDLEVAPAAPVAGARVPADHALAAALEDLLAACRVPGEELSLF